MLTIENLSVAVDGREILNDINLNIQNGERRSGRWRKY